LAYRLAKHTEQKDCHPVSAFADIEDRRMSTMGRRIAARRTELGLTQAQLAERVGLARQTVSMWETGDIRDIRGRHLTVLATVLGVTDKWILFGDAAPAKPRAEDGDTIDELIAIIRRMTPEERATTLQELRAREDQARELYEQLRKRFGG
jgi:transcriptional regulator with XRE-family HTH domain